MKRSTQVAKVLARSPRGIVHDVRFLLVAVAVLALLGLPIAITTSTGTRPSLSRTLQNFASNLKAIVSGNPFLTNTSTGAATSPLHETTANTATYVPAYPLKASANGRYLVDQNNVPFLIVGDSPQAMIAKVSETDADAYFADRKNKGINSVWINLICSTDQTCNADGSTYDGIPPFTTPGDLSTPNEAYFTRADDMIQLAAKYGINVILDPIETAGWLPVLENNGATKDYNYGVYLGNRYKNFPNIIWMSGNDFQTWTNATDDTEVQAVAKGIQSEDKNHLHTVELNYNDSGSLDDPTWAPLIGLDAAYTYYSTYRRVLTEYNRANSMPMFLIEDNYEWQPYAGGYSGPHELRTQEYWSLLSGASGQVYGNAYIWPFPSGWQNHLSDPGIIQLGYVTNLFAARSWYNLVPDQNHTVVTAGYGTFDMSQTFGNTSDYLTAARTADGKLVIAYMPTVRTITVDLTQLTGNVTARWYDPTDGTYKAIAGSPFPNSGSRQFTPPGKNGAGDGDWVLALEAN